MTIPTIKLDDICADFFEKPQDIAGFVAGVKDEVLRFGCAFIADAFEELDEKIRNSGQRKKNWEIVRKDTKSMLASIGQIQYRKTLYKNRRTGERTYLLDRYLGFEENARMTEDAEAQILEEAIQTSYRRGSEAASLLDSVSKGTVKNRIHGLQFPKAEVAEEKKQVKYLYIDADEDHAPLQYIEKKGYTKEGNRAQKNSVQVKLVYVYEGIEPKSPAGSRYRLIEPHCFSGVYEGKDNEALWGEVSEYIEGRYDLENIEKIYLNADGGRWIREYRKKLEAVTEVLDEYHINKHLTQMTGHLYDSADEGRQVLRDSIR